MCVYKLGSILLYLDIAGTVAEPTGRREFRSSATLDSQRFFDSIHAHDVVFIESINNCYSSSDN